MRNLRLGCEPLHLHRQPKRPNKAVAHTEDRYADRTGFWVT